MKKISFLLLLVVYCNLACGQMKNIVIDSINAPNEPSIAIDPRNTSHMVAGSNTKNYYVSTDGGYHWYNDTLKSTYGVFGDPVIIADTTGAFYYFHLADNPSIPLWPMWADRIVAQRMDDISAGTWDNGGYTGYVPTPAIADKPGVALDTRTNTLYVTWTQFDRYGSAASTDSSNILFSKSEDRGDTWSAPKRINNVAGNCTDDDPTVEGAVPCVGPNGEVYVAWAANDEIMFDKSTDGGATWLDSNTQVTDVPGGWNYNVPGLNRCNGLPYTACDLSNGFYRGYIYINWTDQRNGPANTDVWICKSPDNGQTWSSPIKVNDDTGKAQQFLSSMAVDPATGYVYVLFYDRRNFAPDTNLTDVYLAVSKDGGETFQNFKISENPFSPFQPKFFGDYTFISAFHNVVRPIWGSLSGPASSPRQQIMTAIIDTTITGTAVKNTEVIQNSYRIYPNPFREQTTISYDLASTSHVSVSVTDISGRTIAILENNSLVQAGNHVLKFNASDYHLSPGLYFARFETNDFVQMQKLLLKK